MISNTYNRYLWLLNILLIHKRLTFEEISHLWADSYLSEGKPLSLRTFHSHRHAVEEMFQVCIECDTSDGYVYYIEDADTLYEDKARQWVLNSFQVCNLVNEGQQLHDRILLEDIPQGSEYLPVIIQAMQKNCVLAVTYQPFYEDAPTLFHVEPYCMKVYHQRWYVLGYFQEREAIRQLSLDRVRALHLTDNTFDYPKDFSPEEYYSNVVGIWTREDAPVQKVVIRAYGQQCKYLRTLPLHHSQEELSHTDDYTDFQYRLCITDDLVRELVAKGSTIQVLQPEELKQQVLNSALGIINRYKE